MRVVLDINVLLISLPVQSKYRPIFDSLKFGVYNLLITNEIIFEYEEMIGKKTSPVVAENVLRLLLSLPNVIKISNIYFKWKLIVNDPDDNKYPDCAVAGNADLLVSNDSDFKVLNQTKFPNITLLTAEEFLELLSNLHD